MSEAARVVVMSTLATKTEETEFLVERLQFHGVEPIIVDLSLETGGAVVGGDAKLTAMGKAIHSAIVRVTDALNDGANVVVGLGGGTGGEIAIRVMRALPITFPKVLISTLPFDPRFAMADSSIVLVPTLADLAGLNATLREILENAAAMSAGLTATRRKSSACVHNPSVGITALGATEVAICHLIGAFNALQAETTVFHANGYGGAAFGRFAERGAFHTIIDLTPHELTRLYLAGSHADMPHRFSAAPDKPRIVLPGGMNFIGLGQKSLVPSKYLARPHYEHSGFFTHVKVTEDEMRLVADRLVESLNAMTGPVELVVPMGGFSHQDCEGGEIEDATLREVFLQRAKEGLRAGIPVTTVDAHIGDERVTDAIMTAYAALHERHRIAEHV
ncbi:MAG: Tm-1-like ATP-binding domain-containing protein [Pseudomonadota bacterium]